MSLPPALTVNVPPDADDEPASDGLPTSRLSHGAGSAVVPDPESDPELDPELTRRLLNLAVVITESTWLVTASPTYEAAVMLFVTVPAVVKEVPFDER